MQPRGARGSRLAIALAVLLVLAASPWGAPVTPLDAKEVDLVELHRQWLDAVNRGDVPAAVNLFVEDAVYVGGLTCAPFPHCRGREAIRAEFETLAREHAVIDLASAGTSRTDWATWVTTRYELRSDGIQAAGVERAIGAITLAARGDRVVSIRFFFDRADEQTATFLTTRPDPLAPQAVRVPSPEGRLVDVGGRRMYLECVGTGSPAVIFEGGANSGAAASAKIWSGSNGRYPHVTILPDVAKMTRTCSYDRAGYGLSDPGPTPHTYGSFADDLHALLHAAAIEPPYVLVGISLGGPIVQLFASHHPSEVAGIVQLDPTVHLSGRVEAFLPPHVAASRAESIRRTRARDASPQGPGGGIDHDVSIAELGAAGPLPHVPLVVLSAGVPPNPVGAQADFTDEILARVDQLRLEMHRELAHLVPNGVHQVVDNSGHEMNLFVPDTVTTAVVEVVGADRAGR